VTSPFSSNLLQQPVDTARSHPAPQPTRSVTRVVAAPAPQPVYAPQPTYVAVPVRSGSAVTTIALVLLVLVVGAIAAVGGYVATKQAAPSAHEANVVTGLSMREGFRAGRERGIAAGRDNATETAATTTALRAAAVRQRAYDAAFARGEKAGRASYHRPVYSGGSGYRGPRVRSSFGGAVSSAISQAQSLANLTGAPVDVEVYN